MVIEYLKRKMQHGCTPTESLKAAIERKREREQAQRDQDALMYYALKRHSKASPIQLLEEGNKR